MRFAPVFSEADIAKIPTSSTYPVEDDGTGHAFPSWALSYVYLVLRTQLGRDEATQVMHDVRDRLVSARDRV